MYLVPKKYYFDHIFDNLLENNDDMLMRSDIYEKDGSYHFEAELPGFDKSEIKVDFNNGNLSISAEKEEINESDDKKYLRKERIYNKMNRRFYFGEKIDQNNIKAEFNNGILKVVLPKIEEEETTTAIEIQ